MPQVFWALRYRHLGFVVLIGLPAAHGATVQQ